MKHEIIAYAAIGIITAATLAAAIIAVLLIRHRSVPRWLALGDGVLCVTGLCLHLAAQVDDDIGNAFVIAVPFLVVGAVSGVVLAWRRVRGERPKTTLTVAHAANLLLALILVLEGVWDVWGKATVAT